MSVARVARLLCLALCACGDPASTIVGQVGEDQWRTLNRTKIQARCGRLDTGELVLAVDDVIVARGPAAKGTELPIRLEGHDCTVVARNTYEDSVVRSRDGDATEENAPRVASRPLKTTTLRGLTLEVRCADGPVPGSEASLRGAHSRAVLPWAIPGLVLGIIAGLFARPDTQKALLAFLFGLAALVGAAWCTAVAFDDVYVLTGGSLFVAAAIVGIVGGRLGEPNGEHIGIAWTVTFVIGVVGCAWLWPLWSPGAPLVALLAGAVLAIIAAVIAVSIKAPYG